MDKISRRVKVGVMGSSASKVDSSVVSLAAELGRVIAGHHCILVTGATTGVPDLVSRSAQSHGGLTIGISPAISRQEHVSKFLLPDDAADIMIYTGFGLKGRNVINVRACDIVIVFGGGIGTLNEFTIALDEGKVIGVLEQTGGVADRIRELAELSKGRDESRLIYDSDPASLIEKCLCVFGESERADEESASVRRRS